MLLPLFFDRPLGPGAAEAPFGLLLLFVFCSCGFFELGASLFGDPFEAACVAAEEAARVVRILDDYVFSAFFAVEFAADELGFYAVRVFPVESFTVS